MGLRSTLGPVQVDWAVLTVLVEDADPPRGPRLAAAVAAIEAALARPCAAVLDGYRPRCATFGRRVRARLVPLGRASPTVAGTATDVRPNGGLVTTTDDGRRAVVPPQELGRLEDRPGA